jgi:uncharacterized protein (TIGR00299 family) protein
MKIAYFDCFAGASGDMILGALLDAGLPLKTLKAEIDKLHLDHYDLRVEKTVKKGISGSQAIVIIDERHHHYHRCLSDIKDIIKKSDLSDNIKEMTIKIFTKLAEAEAKVHHVSPDRVHFHEIGAMDAIIDIVGSVAGLEALGVDAVYCSSLHVGSGMVECAHGTLPVPAPATLELIRGKPVYSTGVKGELLTPTGAAILTTLSSSFGPMPGMTVETIGYGAGRSEPAIPNLLRVSVGEQAIEWEGYDTERVAVIETVIDDMNPQIYQYIMEKLLNMGVKDIFLTPVYMKKNRPGTLVTVLCCFEMVTVVADILIRETTSIGLRWHIDDRIKADRKIKEIQTPYGPMRFKISGIKDGKVLNIFPEYEDCKRIAAEKNIPIKEVMIKAMASVSSYQSQASEK